MCSRKLFKAVALLMDEFREHFSFHSPVGEDFLLRLQEHMDKLKEPQQLIVYKDHDFKKPFFAGEIIRRVKDRVYLLCLENSHMCFLAEPAKFFTARLWDCCLKVSRGSSHSCGVYRFCWKCGTRDCWGSPENNSDGSGKVTDCSCIDCGTTFSRRSCYYLHTMRSPSHCDSHATCEKCMTVVQREGLRKSELMKHQCLGYKCKYCRESFSADDDEPHLCVYQTPSESQLGGNKAKFFRVHER